MKNNYYHKILFAFILNVLFVSISQATDYTVSTKADLQTRMTNAVAGDNIIVTNGTYDWGQIVFNNTKNNSASAWITLKPQTLSGVVFTGTTYLQFAGTRIQVSGFKFNGNSIGTTGLIQFRSSSTKLANYCRLTDITLKIKSQRV